MTSVHVGRREGPRLLAPVQGKPRRALAGLELATGARGREVGLLAGSSSVRLLISSIAAMKSTDGISSGTSGRSISSSCTASGAWSRTDAAMPATTSRSKAMTSRKCPMNPSSTSMLTYSARWRVVSWGSARKTGPTS